MITQCVGPDLLGLEDMGFMMDVSSLMTIAVPAALCYALWRVFVTERFAPRGGIVALGLDNTTATQTELYGRRVSGWRIFVYTITSFLTFNVGVFVFDAYSYLQGWLCHDQWHIF